MLLKDGLKAHSKNERVIHYRRELLMSEVLYSRDDLKKESMARVRTILKEIGGGKMKGAKNAIIDTILEIQDKSSDKDTEKDDAEDGPMYTKEGLRNEKMSQVRIILKEMGGGKMKGSKDTIIDTILELQANNNDDYDLGGYETEDIEVGDTESEIEDEVEDTYDLGDHESEVEDTEGDEGEDDWYLIEYRVEAEKRLYGGLVEAEKGIKNKLVLTEGYKYKRVSIKGNGETTDEFKRQQDLEYYRSLHADMTKTLVTIISEVESARNQTFKMSFVDIVKDELYVSRDGTPLLLTEEERRLKRIPARYRQKEDVKRSEELEMERTLSEDRHRMLV